MVVRPPRTLVGDEIRDAEASTASGIDFPALPGIYQARGIAEIHKQSDLYQLR